MSDLHVCRISTSDFTTSGYVGLHGAQPAEAPIPKSKCRARGGLVTSLVLLFQSLYFRLLAWSTPGPKRCELHDGIGVDTAVGANCMPSWLCLASWLPRYVQPCAATTNLLVPNYIHAHSLN